MSIVIMFTPSNVVFLYVCVSVFQGEGGSVRGWGVWQLPGGSQLLLIQVRLSLVIILSLKFLNAILHLNSQSGEHVCIMCINCSMADFPEKL